MRIDNEYIEMCQKAEEIQELWKPKVGDLRFNRLHTEPRIWIIDYDDENDFSEKWWNDRMCWIPRQEDLQEFVMACMGVTVDLVIQSLILYYQEEYGFEDDLNTLWLCFTMFKCYNKEYNWEEKKWVEL